jgi:hypothetical protein
MQKPDAHPYLRSGHPRPIARHHDVMKLLVLPDRLAVCRLARDVAVPAWAWQGTLVSVTRTDNELSIVCDEASVPECAATVERGWRVLRVAGTLDFALVGVLARLAAPLAEAGVSIFALSTFDTDYLLVREASLDVAVAALCAAGHDVVVSAPAPAE